MIILVFDTETTGKPKNSKAPASDSDNWPRIVQLGLLVSEDGKTLHEYKTLIKPKGWVIDKEAEAIHGISLEMCEADGIPIEEALSAFIAYLQHADLVVCHNTGFDIPVMGSEMMRNNMTGNSVPKFCTMLNSVDVCKIPGPYGFKWPKLQELHSHLFQESFDGAHDAFSDVLATNKCFWALKDRNLITV